MDTATFFRITATQWTAIGTIGLTFSTIVLAFFTLGMVFVGFLQLKAFNKAIMGDETANKRLKDHEEATRKFSYQDARAYICVTSVLVEKHPTNQTRVITVTCKNFGKTPAYAVMCSGEGIEREKEINPAIESLPEPVNITEFPKQVIAPGGESKARFLLHPRGGEKNGPRFFVRYFYGTISYRDVFEKINEAYFCKIHRRTGGSFTWDDQFIGECDHWKRDT